MAVVPKTLVVIGGGAAGFFCAVNAARLNPSLQVVVLEKTGKLLSKVRISGGGRCNLTHNLSDITEMTKRYPRGQHFVKKTFHQFFTTDTISWFEKRGVATKAEADGRMFPVSDNSQSIIDCLLNEANIYGVTIRLNTPVLALQQLQGGWRLELDGGKTLDAAYVCVATGGYPKSSMFQWLTALGHSIAEPLPSLFTFNLPGHPIAGLMGLSVAHARVRIESTKLVEEGPVLITHWGLSGPAVLRLSAWGARILSENNYHFKAHINWVPAYNEQSLKELFTEQRLQHPAKKINNHNITDLPNRLWLFLAEQSGISRDLRFADMNSKTENAFIRNLVDYTVAVAGKTTFKEEFVTAGGINTSEVDPATMMSRKLPHLFFAGEVVDVDGITGGYNFQHAWTTGWIAAKAITTLAG